VITTLMTNSNEDNTCQDNEDIQDDLFRWKLMKDNNNEYDKDHKIKKKLAMIPITPFNLHLGLIHNHRQFHSD